MKLNDALPRSRKIAAFAALLPLVLVPQLYSQSVQSTTRQIDAQAEGGLKTRLAIGYLYSPESELSRGAVDGDVSINHFALELNAIKPIDEKLNLLFGFSEKYTDLDASGTLPLPDRLHAVGLSVGAQRKLSDWLSPSWTGTIRLETDFSSDSSGLSEAKASFGGAILVTYVQSDALSWDFGILAFSHGDLPILPMIGAKWDFAPQWTATFGFPNTGVTYEYSPKLNLHAGLSFDGGLYHVSTERAPGLGNTWLEYSEFRFGAKAEYAFTQSLKLTVGGGIVLDRELSYYDRDYSIEGDSAGYMSVSLEARF